MNSTPEFGSDAIVQLFRQLGIDRIAMNPGASFRGLHDSLVNFGDGDIHMITALHEEHAVALAHGYAKASGRPIAVALHTNVGLMHASMALFNAYCDRVPMLVLVGNGPLDADLRRPWIDWVHTTHDAPSLVRNSLKWDDVPISLPATLDSLARAWELTQMEPKGPTCVVLDVTTQEAAIVGRTTMPASGAAWVDDQPHPSHESVARALNLLKLAKNPVVLLGSVGHETSGLNDRVGLVEAIGARVITDLKANSSFPSQHPANVGRPGIFLPAEAQTILRESDLILSLNWTDLAGTMRQAGCLQDCPTIVAGFDHISITGQNQVHQRRVAPTVVLPGNVDLVIEALVEAIDLTVKAWTPPTQVPRVKVERHEKPLTLTDLAQAIASCTESLTTTVVRLPLGANGADWSFNEPLDFLGSDGGAGIGSALGMTIGAALALRDTDRLVLSVVGDGEFLMAVQALWTAAHERLPVLIIVANNHTYFNDEVHQERVAQTRGRDVSRKHIGLTLTDPIPDIVGLSRAQGLTAFGPATNVDELHYALESALDAVSRGAAVVLDVSVEPGYSAAMASGLTHG